MIQKEIHSHRKLFILFFTGFIVGHSWPVKAQAVIGAREVGLGQAMTALPESAWAVFSNPAMMAEEPSISFFGIRYFGLSEISDMAVSAIYPHSWGTWTAGIHRYGFDLFNESQYRLGYKNSFLGFHYGGILNYTHISQGGGYGSAGAAGIDLGVAALIVPELWIGAKATNLNQPTLGSSGTERLPRNLSIGFSYLLTRMALFTTEIYKASSFPLSYRGGLEVTIMDGFSGRAGITTAPQSFTGGFGYRGAYWSANVAVHRHENQVLGYSPGIDLNIFW